MNSSVLFFVLIVSLLGNCVPLYAQSSRAQRQKQSRSHHKKKTAHRKRKVSARVRRMARAFVASTQLKPMARQLLENRSPAAYAGVQTYARQHVQDDAGTLAWLVVGYAHILDHDYAKAIPPLKRASFRAGDLSDYTSYFLAMAYGGTGDSAGVIATLKNFEQDHPDSLFARDAYVVYAAALVAGGQAQRAISLLEAHRQPPLPDVELALGRAYAAAGDTSKAAETFHRLYFSMPLAEEADAASNELKKLPVVFVPQPTFTERKLRADLLLQGRRYADAIQEYRDLVSHAAEADRASVQLSLASALHRSGRDKDAKDLLDSISGVTGDPEAQRLYQLVEIARTAEDEDAALKLVTNLRQTASTSPWFEKSLLIAANMRLLKREYDPAIDLFRELEQRFPEGNRAAYAHWKVAWLSMRQNRKDEARKEMEDQIAKYPGSPQVPAALYWRARIGEQDQDFTKAGAYYQKITDRFSNYYYADLARQRLKQIPANAALVASVANHGSAGGGAVADPPTEAAGNTASTTPQSDPLLEKIPAANLPSTPDPDDLPDDDLRVQKALLLQNGALTSFAVRELQAAAPSGKVAGWWTIKTVELYQDDKHYDRAIEAVKRVVPEYFAVDTAALPRAYWTALFPRPYWTELKKQSARNRLDPFLVAALIRQESAFNPGAISSANALGLMQLLPVTGRAMARQLHVRHFSNSLLVVPNVNMQLGTRYFRQLIDQFGSVEYALAAYNAGQDRVKDWTTNGNFQDVPEFVESIPFTETREYVQAIMRNATVYRKLYDTP
ncbi:MAG TPA: transglycosylase SLT domain-containing protein [Terriglobales bacterium]|nr:transglycosylase SLT domain-containing protein [Terriglobales bacterium]